MSTQVQSPFPLFTTLIGAPLNLGYVYIGDANQDPETHPKQAYWDFGLTTPAAQPLRTNGGYIVNSGSPASVFTDGAFSIRVRSNSGGTPGAQIFYRADVESLEVLFASSDGASLIGTASGDTVQESLDSAWLADRPFTTTYDASNPGAFGGRIFYTASGKQVDGIFTDGTVTGALGAGYGIHCIMTADASVPEGAAGGIGGAAGGPGWASGVIGNRYEAGPGNGGSFTRTGSGAGYGILATSYSTGANNSAAFIIKQNPSVGVPAGSGPAAWVINDSDVGEAQRMRSAATNTESNTSIIERLNGAQGIAQLVRITGGGARTSAVIGSQSVVIPGVASTGTGTVTAHDAQISSNVTGSADTRGFNLSNGSTGGIDAFGAVAAVTGVNTTNYGIFLTAANATTNWALYCAVGNAYFAGAKIRAPNLPTYADNAAASAGGLSAGDFYRTATGVLMVRF